jgi:hypothetical protein
MPFTLLEVSESQRGELVATESTCQQQRKQRPITFPYQSLAIGCLPECSCLLGRQPVAQSDVQLLNALDPPNSRSQIGAKKAAIRRFVCQPTNGSQPEINCPRCEMARFQLHPVGDHNRFAERQARLQPVPLHKFVNGDGESSIESKAGRDFGRPNQQRWARRLAQSLREVV